MFHFLFTSVPWCSTLPVVTCLYFRQLNNDLALVYQKQPISISVAHIHDQNCAVTWMFHKYSISLLVYHTLILLLLWPRGFESALFHFLLPYLKQRLYICMERPTMPVAHVQFGKCMQVFARLKLYLQNGPLMLYLGYFNEIHTVKRNGAALLFREFVKPMYANNEITLLLCTNG